jgi:hypothetical protein
MQYSTVNGQSHLVLKEKKTKRGYTVCSSGYAATDNNEKAANNSALTVTNERVNPL